LGVWGFGYWPNPQSPIPNPQSPIPNILLNKFNLIFRSLYYDNILIFKKI
jgi:hypothetical protein